MRLQLSSGRARGLTLVPGLALALAGAPVAAATFADEDPNAEVTMQFFTDSDQVLVRSQIGHCAFPLRGAAMSLQWNNERVRIPAISAPVGSPEAVDAITTASRPISGNAYEDFVKTRNELTSAVTLGNTSLAYYVSSETDYLGQQVSASHHRGFQDDLLDVAMGASFGWDAIEPVTDDDTNTAADTKTTLHWNAVGTRVLSPTTVVRLGVEVNVVNGLQHNPYRNVYAGGTNVPENHPDSRQRRDLFLKLHRWMANKSSLKLGYRLYGDDWGIASHELGTTLHQYVTRSLFASYEYRWYTQSAADFHRDEYATTGGVDGYVTGDYRMARLSSHLFGFALNLDGTALESASPIVGRMGVTLRYERYFNSNNYSASFVTTQLGYRF